MHIGQEIFCDTQSLHAKAIRKRRLDRKKKMSNDLSHLESLRKIMQSLSLDAFLVGSEDAHQSEYVCDADMRRSFISGFTGSAGTALILQDSAFLWTDGRYFLQAEQELTSAWTLMKSGEPGVLELQDWVMKHLCKGQRFGVDPSLVTTASAKAMISKFSAEGIDVVTVTENPVDMVWQVVQRPPYPTHPVEVVELDRSGQHHEEKLEKVKEKLRENNAAAFVVTMLDEVAWLLNIRGADVDFNPVTISYCVVTTNEDGVILFVDEKKVPESARAHFGSSVSVMPYSAIDGFLTNLVKDLDATQSTQKIWIDDTKTNYRLFLAIQGRELFMASPLTLPKALKNDVELEGIRNAHIRDGAALTAFIHWLEQRVQSDPGTFNEQDVVEKLETFREKMNKHVGPSFSTIAGFGPNGAIIHYKPERATARALSTDSLFLLDSGAQYRDGTTDVTRYVFLHFFQLFCCCNHFNYDYLYLRTMHFGTPTAHMKMCYTAVLKGHIALASLVIPEGVLGSRIDAVARTALWKLGLDYNHGTGHGVGAYLNVHEGPHGIGIRKRDNEVVGYSNIHISIRSDVFSLFLGIFCGYDCFQ
jgi:Xaa-Pro aminopeptidase